MVLPVHFQFWNFYLFLIICLYIGLIRLITVMVFKKKHELVINEILANISDNTKLNYRVKIYL